MTTAPMCEREAGRCRKNSKRAQQKPPWINKRFENWCQLKLEWEYMRKYELCLCQMNIWNAAAWFCLYFCFTPLNCEDLTKQLSSDWRRKPSNKWKANKFSLFLWVTDWDSVSTAGIAENGWNYRGPNMLFNIVIPSFIPARKTYFITEWD